MPLQVLVSLSSGEFSSSSPPPSPLLSLGGPGILQLGCSTQLAKFSSSKQLQELLNSSLFQSRKQFSFTKVFRFHEENLLEQEKLKENKENSSSPAGGGENFTPISEFYHCYSQSIRDSLLSSIGNGKNSIFFHLGSNSPMASHKKILLSGVPASPGLYAFSLSQILESLKSTQFAMISIVQIENNQLYDLFSSEKIPLKLFSSAGGPQRGENQGKGKENSSTHGLEIPGLKRIKFHSQGQIEEICQFLSHSPASGGFSTAHHCLTVEIMEISLKAQEKEENPIVNRWCKIQFVDCVDLSELSAALPGGQPKSQGNSKSPEIPSTAYKGTVKMQKSLLDRLYQQKRHGFSISGPELSIPRLETTRYNRDFDTLERILAGLARGDSHLPYRTTVFTHFLSETLIETSEIVFLTYLRDSLSEFSISLPLLRFSDRLWANWTLQTGEKEKSKKKQVKQQERIGKMEENLMGPMKIRIPMKAPAVKQGKKSKPRKTLEEEQEKKKREQRRAILAALTATPGRGPLFNAGYSAESSNEIPPRPAFNETQEEKTSQNDHFPQPSPAPSHAAPHHSPSHSSSENGNPPPTTGAILLELHRILLRLKILHGPSPPSGEFSAPPGDSIHIRHEKWHLIARLQEILSFLQQFHPSVYELIQKQLEHLNSFTGSAIGKLFLQQKENPSVSAVFAEDAATLSTQAQNTPSMPSFSPTRQAPAAVIHIHHSPPPPPKQQKILPTSQPEAQKTQFQPFSYSSPPHHNNPPPSSSSSSSSSDFADLLNDRQALFKLVEDAERAAQENSMMEQQLRRVHQPIRTSKSNPKGTFAPNSTVPQPLVDLSQHGVPARNFDHSGRVYSASNLPVPVVWNSSSSNADRFSASSYTLPTSSSSYGPLSFSSSEGNSGLPQNPPHFHLRLNQPNYFP